MHYPSFIAYFFLFSDWKRSLSIGQKAHDHFPGASLVIGRGKGVVIEIEMAANKKSSNKRVFCPHCKDFVAWSLYYQHKQLYYDSSNKKWKEMKSTDKTTFTVNFEFSPPQAQESADQTEDYRGKLCV